MIKGNKNVLFRVSFRSFDKTLADKEVNIWAESIYMAVHQGEQGYFYTPANNKQSIRPK